MGASKTGRLVKNCAGKSKEQDGIPIPPSTHEIANSDITASLQIRNDELRSGESSAAGLQTTLHRHKLRVASKSLGLMKDH